jgi:DNA-binding SARP family transcriptional activator
MGELRLALLGRPRVVRDDAPLTGWTLRKSLALLAYLAVTGLPHSRGALAGLLWRDCTEDNARSDLRRILAELRRQAPSHLTITRAEVAFDRASPYWLDVEAFEQGIVRALALRENPVTPAGAATLAGALDLYRGDFLAGLELHRAPAFEEWVLLEREHLRNLALQALHALVDHHAARMQPERTLAYLDRLLALEPGHEEAHRHKMLLLAQGGQRSAALRQYEACRQAVQALDAEPDWETTALYERIRAGAACAPRGEGAWPWPACSPDPPGRPRGRSRRDPGAPAGSVLPVANPGRSRRRRQDPFGIEGRCRPAAARKL